MTPRPRLIPALEHGFLKASATLHDPEVTLSPWDEDRPLVVIEEGGVVVELEFPDAESLACFQARVAALRVAGDRRGKRNAPPSKGA